MITKTSTDRQSFSSNRVKERLDELALTIELTLISVVQGVALAALGSSCLVLISNFDFGHIPYILSALMFILIFWSGAIVHALSFIDWPLDLWHNFLYFIATLAEVLAFGQMDKPILWYGFVALFFGVAMILYIYDLGLIKKHRELYTTEPEKRLFDHIKGEQLFEMRTIIPAGIVFNGVSALLIWSYPEVFIQNNYHIYLAIVQMVFILFFLVNSVKSFNKRKKLITECI